MNIVIWGTGNIGKYLFEQIKNNKNYEVSYFVDRNKTLCVGGGGNRGN